MKSLRSNKQFNSLIKSEKPFILDFYADWCGPCQTLLPTVEKLAEEYKDTVEILKVNIDEQKTIASHFKVKSIPAIFFMKKNEIKDKINGMTTEHTMKKKIKKLLK